MHGGRPLSAPRRPLSGGEPGCPPGVRSVADLGWSGVVDGGLPFRFGGMEDYLRQEMSPLSTFNNFDQKSPREADDKDRADRIREDFISGMKRLGRDERHVSHTSPHRHRHYSIPGGGFVRDCAAV